MQANKKKRYEKVIIDLFSNAILKEIYDPFIKLTTISYVELSNDKTHLKVFVSTYRKESVDKLVKALNHISGFFRSILANNLDFRIAPKVVFLKDSTIDKAETINQILEDLKKE